MLKKHSKDEIHLSFLFCFGCFHREQLNIQQVMATDVSLQKIGL